MTRPRHARSDYRYRATARDTFDAAVVVFGIVALGVLIGAHPWALPGAALTAAILAAWRDLYGTDPDRTTDPDPWPVSTSIAPALRNTPDPDTARRLLQDGRPTPTVTRGPWAPRTPEQPTPEEQP